MPFYPRCICSVLKQSWSLVAVCNVPACSFRPFASKAETRYLSIDVEAAATGKGHSDRAPCHIAVVDGKCRTLTKLVVKVPNLYSPQTPVTGLTKVDIDRGCFLAKAMVRVRKFLGPHVVLVGQYPASDIKWLGLKQGIDFREVIDISTHFRSWNHRTERWIYFSLRQTVYGLLGRELGKRHHCPLEDAKASMELFNRYLWKDKTGEKARIAGKKLRRMRQTGKFPLSVSQRIGNVDGVCGYAFDRNRCICGQPLLRDK